MSEILTQNRHSDTTLLKLNTSLICLNVYLSPVKIFFFFKYHLIKKKKTIFKVHKNVFIKLILDHILHQLST